MLLDQSGAAPEAWRSAREIEFVEALHRYMASYAAQQRRRVRGDTQLGKFGRGGIAGRIARRVAGLITEALRRLGAAMSGGGRFPPVGPV